MIWFMPDMQDKLFQHSYLLINVQHTCLKKSRLKSSLRLWNRRTYYPHQVATLNNSFDHIWFREKNQISFFSIKLIRFISNVRQLNRNIDCLLDWSDFFQLSVLIPWNKIICNHERERERERERRPQNTELNYWYSIPSIYLNCVRLNSFIGKEQKNPHFWNVSIFLVWIDTIKNILTLLDKSYLGRLWWIRKGICVAANSMNIALTGAVGKRRNLSYHLSGPRNVL